MSDVDKPESERPSRTSTMRPPPLALKPAAAPIASSPIAVPPVVPRPSALPPRPGRAPVTPVRTELLPNDRPTPRSTVIPRLPPTAPGTADKMRPKLETLIFHGAPPPPPLSPPRLPVAPPATYPRASSAPESFQDVLSMELLEDVDDGESSNPPTPYGEPEAARTDRPPPFSIRPAAARPPSPAGRMREPRIIAAIAAAIALPALLALGLDRPPKTVSARSLTAPAPASTTPLPTPRAIGTCTVDGPAHLLARRALVRGGVEATSLDDRIAFAALTSVKSGTAFELDARTLTVKSSAKIVTGDPLRHLVPELGEESPVEAETDVAGFRTLADAEGDSAVGARDGFVVWGPRDGDGMVRLWRLPPQQAMDAPRVGALGTGGERVMALRVSGSGAGGASEIRIGSFRGGQTTSELTRLSATGIVGTPSLDTHGDEAIVTWAQRDKSTSPWGVRWTRWAPQAGLAVVHQLALPPGGPGDRAMAPTVSALGDGRVLLSWTEAGRGRNQVRAQVFDPADHPLGGPLAISGEDAVAGQEQIALTDAGHGAIAYLVARRGSFELRATAIDCAPR